MCGIPELLILNVILFFSLTLDPQRPNHLMLEREKVQYFIPRGLGNILPLHEGPAPDE